MGPLWEGTTLGSGVSSCSLKCGEEGVAASPRCCRRGAHSTGDQQGAGVDRRCSPHRAPLQHAGRRSLHHHRRVTVTFCDGSRRPCGGRCCCGSHGTFRGHGCTPPGSSLSFPTHRLTVPCCPGERSDQLQTSSSEHPHGHAPDVSADEDLRRNQTRTRTAPSRRTLSLSCVGVQPSWPDPSPPTPASCDSVLGRAW